MTPDGARLALDAHVRRIVGLHFSPATGTPYWLRWAEQHGRDPVREVQGFDDLAIFGHFDKDQLKNAPHSDWMPAPYVGRPFHVFETGGTTGLPTQRMSWDDHLTDYTAFADTLDREAFPGGTGWLICGPTGPRRLRITMEHLANVRGSVAYHLDLDPRWVRKLIQAGDAEGARRYQEHVIEQALVLLKHRPIAAIFTTPRLLESIGEAVDLASTGVKGVLCGGTSMSPQTLRFLAEEVLDGSIPLVPVYGNTLMGLAASEPVGPETGWEVRYHAPQPRAVLRVVGDDDQTVPYGERGRVELTTLTEELFMPRLLERDEAIRRPPTTRWPWDATADVRPWSDGGAAVVEGVY